MKTDAYRASSRRRQGADHPRSGLGLCQRLPGGKPRGCAAAGERELTWKPNQAWPGNGQAGKGDKNTAPPVCPGGAAVFCLFSWSSRAPEGSACPLARKGRGGGSRKGCPARQRRRGESAPYRLMKRMSMVATSARVASPWGSRPLSPPVMMPCSTAQVMAVWA